MKLGILARSDNHLQHIIGLTNAAISAGHEVIIFTMDSGTRLLEIDEFGALARKGGVTVSFCDFNASGMGIVKELVPEEIVRGSQLNNAKMVHEADRVIRL